MVVMTEVMAGAEYVASWFLWLILVFHPVARVLANMEGEIWVCILGFLMVFLVADRVVFFDYSYFFL